MALCKISNQEPSCDYTMVDNKGNERIENQLMLEEIADVISVNEERKYDSNYQSIGMRPRYSYGLGRIGRSKTKGTHIRDIIFNRFCY
jgi:hypothetical protein